MSHLIDEKMIIDSIRDLNEISCPDIGIKVAMKLISGRVNILKYDSITMLEILVIHSEITSAIDPDEFT